jgi:hypothetical protein
MSKKQWLLIVAAIIAIIFLFSLPRIIIDNDPENLEGLVDDHIEHSDSTEIPQHSKIYDTQYDHRPDLRDFRDRCQ